MARLGERRQGPARVHATADPAAPRAAGLPPARLPGRQRRALGPARRGLAALRRGAAAGRRLEARGLALARGVPERRRDPEPQPPRGPDPGRLVPARHQQPSRRGRLRDARQALRHKLAPRARDGRAGVAHALVRRGADPARLRACRAAPHRRGLRTGSNGAGAGCREPDRNQRVTACTPDPKGRLPRLEVTASLAPRGEVGQFEVMHKEVLASRGRMERMS